MTFHPLPPREACCIIVFVRAPQAGKVKTRLSQKLDKQRVLRIYQSFVDDLLDTVQSVGCPTQIWYHPSDAEPEMRAWLGNAFRCVPQTGTDLGQKMATALQRAFVEGYQQVVLVGSDVPDLPGQIFDEAFTALQTKEAVLGPTLDGGYYLIGFRRSAFLVQAFAGMPWSSSEVFQKTLQVLHQHDLRVHQLPLWRDIDEYSDLVRFYHQNRYSPQVAPRTLAYLAAIGFPLKPADAPE